MDKIIFLAFVGFIIGMGIALFNHEPGCIFMGLGFGLLAGGLLGYLDGDFNDKTQPRTFYDVDRMSQERINRIRGGGRHR